MLLLQTVLSTLVLLLVPGAWLDWHYRRPLWALSRDTILPLLAAAGAFAVGAALLAYLRQRRPITLLDIVLIATAGEGFVGLAVLLVGWEIPRPLLVFTYTGSLVFLTLIFVVPGFHRVKLAGLLVPVAAGVAFRVLYVIHLLPLAPEPTFSRQFVNSSLYGVEVRYYRKFIPKSLASGGGLALLKDGYLLANGDGRLYALQENPADSSLTVRALATRIPVNAAAFRQDTAAQSVNPRHFRVADIHLVIDGKRMLLLASHHYWEPDRKCFTLRVSRLEADYDQFLKGEVADAWSTLWDSSPCLPINPAFKFFAGHQAGGRLAMLDDHTLVVTVGDHKYDGANTEVAYPQDTSASYGKIVSIDLRNGRPSLLSIGHRNPQGLFIDSRGTIWSTEHGPQGGDELNRIQAGANYGWPVVTYGVNYGSHEWKSNPRQGAHDGYAGPVFAWVPSIGISSLIGIEGQLFERWRGDLIIASLVNKSLWRVRLADGHAVVTEPMLVGFRIRDLIEGHSGEIILQDDDGTGIAFLTPVVGEGSGWQLFAQCSGCHALGTGDAEGIGPDLRGVVGRRIASVGGFDYSRALRSVEGSWTEAALDRFLESPAQFAPGNSMEFAGIADQAARQRLIRYLVARH